MRSLKTFRNRLSKAEKKGNWKECIKVCRAAIALTSLDNLNDWFYFRFNLAGILYHSEREKIGEPIDEAVEICNQIIKVMSVDHHPREWAAGHFFLGGIFGFRTDGDSTANREKVIKHFSKALIVCTKESDPYRWASIKAGIGLAFAGLRRGNIRRNLLQAKKHYSEILDVFTPDKYPEDWKDTIEILKGLESRLKKDKRMSRTILPLALALGLAIPRPALAHGNTWPGPVMVNYYCPPVLICVPAASVVYPCAPCFPGPTPRLGQTIGPRAPFAPPSPAPPSERSIPPSTGSPVPGVTESRSYYESFPVDPRSSDKPVGDRCPVGFWNLTGHEITLMVDGKSHVLPAGNNLKLQLARQFIWKMLNHDPQTERIAADTPGLEIVIRR